MPSPAGAAEVAETLRQTIIISQLRRPTNQIAAVGPAARLKPSEALRRRTQAVQDVNILTFFKIFDE
jgi:hypothetical protein